MTCHDEMLGNPNTWNQIPKHYQTQWILCVRFLGLYNVNCIVSQVLQRKPGLDPGSMTLSQLKTWPIDFWNDFSFRSPWKTSGIGWRFLRLIFVAVTFMLASSDFLSVSLLMFLFCLGVFLAFFTLLADFVLLLFGCQTKIPWLEWSPCFFSGQFTAEESTSRFASRFPSCVIFLPRNGTNSSSGKGAVWTLRDGAFRHPLPSIHPLEDPGMWYVSVYYYLHKSSLPRCCLSWKWASWHFQRGWSMILLMVQKSQTSTWDVKKKTVTNGINYQIPKPINMGNLLKAEARIAQPDNLIKRNKFFLYMFT